MLVCFCVHSLPWVVNGPNSLSHILTITLYVIIFFLVMAMHLIKIQINEALLLMEIHCSAQVSSLEAVRKTRH